MSGRKTKKQRNSTLNPSTNSVINALRTTIRQCEGTDSSYIPIVDPNGVGVDVRQELILIKRQSKKVRRAYMLQHRYKIGWIVDADVSMCMMCFKDFGWFRGRFKHHCRACGALVCHDCSPFVTIVPHLDEEKGSRACKSCFGLKPGIFTPETPSPYQPGASGMTLPSGSKKQVAANLFQSPVEGTQANANAGNYTNRTNKTNVSFAPSVPTPSTTSSSNSGIVVRRRGGSGKQNKAGDLGTEEALIQKYLEELAIFEQEQFPKYEEAYKTMRELVPLEIYKSNLKLLIKNGLPEEAATRIFNIKVLWLIITHPIDISKIHLADFRSKYFYDGLDITEMRAVWYCLPDWDAAAPNPLERGKAEWKEGFKSKMDDLVYREISGSLPEHLVRNPAYLAADHLHLFDPEIDIKPRFHRSASFKQEAVESPMPDGLDSESESGSDSSFNISPIVSGKKKPHVPLSVQERQQMYMKNFVEQDDDEDQQDKDTKYRTLLEEINAEAVAEDDDEDDISSLGLDGSTDEFQAEPHTQDLSPGDRMPPSSQGRKLKPASSSNLRNRDDSLTPTNLQKSVLDMEPVSHSLPNPSSKFLQERMQRKEIAASRQSAPPPVDNSRNSSFSTVSNLSRGNGTEASHSSAANIAINANAGLSGPGLQRSMSLRSGTLSPKASFTSNRLSAGGIGYGEDYLGTSLKEEYLTSGRMSLGSDSNMANRVGRGLSPIPVRQTPRSREASHKPIAFPTITPRRFAGDNMASPYSDDSQGGDNSGSCYPYVTIMSEDTPASATFTSVGSPQSFKFLSNSKNYGKKFDSNQQSLSNNSSSNNNSSNPNTPNRSSRKLDISTGASPIIPLHEAVVNVEDEVKPSSVKSPVLTSAVSTQPSSPASSVHTNNTAPMANKRTKQKPAKGDVENALLAGDIGSVLQLMDSEPLAWVYSEAERNEIFWNLVGTMLRQGTDDQDETVAALQDTNLFMIDDEAVDVNVLNSEGQTLLHIAVIQDYARLGKELIKRGADLLIMDTALDSTPLSLSLSYQQDWLVDEYSSSGKEMKLLAFGNAEKKKQYFTSFIVAGHSDKAKDILRSGYVKMTAAEATKLMNTCSGNFDRMKDPVDTFELLESLGASL